MGIGQVFIFIIAAITFILIMIFGYKAISGFLESGEEVAFVQFRSNLESSIQKIYTEFEAIRINEYQTPLQYKKICFVDMDTDAPNDCDSLLGDAYACDVWKDADGYGSVEENVFMQPQAPHRIKVYRISISEERGYLCQDIVEGSFSLMLKGKGDRTELSEAPN